MGEWSVAKNGYVVGRRVGSVPFGLLPGCRPPRRCQIRDSRRFRSAKDFSALEEAADGTSTSLPITNVTARARESPKSISF